MLNAKISGDELCSLTGLTDRRHRQIAKDGYFAPPLRGEYERQAALRGMFRYFREAREKAGATLASERLRKLKEDADKVAIENERSRGNLVETEAVYGHFEGLFVALRQRILASGLSDQEKDELLKDLMGLKGRNFKLQT